MSLHKKSQWLRDGWGSLSRKTETTFGEKDEAGYNRLGTYDYFIVLSPFLGVVEPVGSKHETEVDTLFYNDFRCQFIQII